MQTLPFLVLNQSNKQTLSEHYFIVKLCGVVLCAVCITGLEITAGQRTMSGQDDNLSGQSFVLLNLSGHVHGF